MKESINFIDKEVSIQVDSLLKIFLKDTLIMYAIIKTGGKQHRVSQGDEIAVEKLEGNKGDSLVFDEVLMFVNDDDIKIGTPTVAGAKVISEILEQTKAPKLVVFRMKRRKGYHKKTGHRQPLTRVKITDITI